MKILSSFVLLAFIFFTPLKSVLASSPTKNLMGDKSLLIVEVQIVGEKSNNDLIKIYNQLDYDLDIAGYKLKKRASTGSESSIRVFPQGNKIPAKGYFLWANSKDNYHLKIEANVWSTATLAKNNSIALLNPENKILDGLAWGESQNPFVEEQPFPENPAANQKLERRQINGVYQDTNNNAKDFYLNPPSGLKLEVPSQKNQSESKPEPLEEPEPIIYSSEIVISEILPNTPLGKRDGEGECKETSIKELEKIDINTSLIKELQKITGVGPVLAQRIIDARPFYSLEELTKVNGIGPKTLEEIKKQGLAWVNPELKPPKTEKTESPKTGLTAVAEPLQQGSLGGKIPKSLFVFVTGLALAIFSGVIILILKNKLKKNYNKNI